MKLLGLFIGFGIILLLNSKKIKLNMGLSILIGAVVTGLFSLDIRQMSVIIFEGVTEPVSIKLIIIVTLISGLGYILKDSGDFKNMVDSLMKLIKNVRFLNMFIPILIGTLQIPGGAILSAPMVEKSGKKINLNNLEMTVINLFFRHIFLFVYPLFSSIILASELFNVTEFFIIKNNFFIMIAGVLVAYFVFFNKNHVEKTKNKSNIDFFYQLKKFLISFYPILTIIILALVFKIYFPLSVLIGVLLALGKNLNKRTFIKDYYKRIKHFIFKGINYKMPLLIIGIMSFKSIIDKADIIKAEQIQYIMDGSFLPLFLIIIVAGYITGYLLGNTSAGLGILIPIFSPVIPAGNIGAYVSLLFTSLFAGYLISPLHPCLALTKEYFKVDYKNIYKLSFLPTTVMLIIGVILIYI